MQFAPTEATRPSAIYQTDELGNRLEFKPVLFQPQQYSINYFVKQFTQKGIFYFSTVDQRSDKGKSGENLLTVIVLPDQRFHYKEIAKNKFDAELIIATNAKDFVVWKFETDIIHDVIQLHENPKFDDLMLCHTRAVAARKRRCLAVSCKTMAKRANFFCNPGKKYINGCNRVVRFLSYSNENEDCKVQFVCLDFEEVTGVHNVSSGI